MRLAAGEEWREEGRRGRVRDGGMRTGARFRVPPRAAATACQEAAAMTAEGGGGRTGCWVASESLPKETTRGAQPPIAWAVLFIPCGPL